MMIPDTPRNESERLAALEDLDILDTEREAVFDRITRLASHIIDAPVFLIAFMDEERNWFKSAIGVDLEESPRDISFCGHAIHHDEVMMVPDAQKDPRFADNPLVTGELGARFYAGAPLILSDGIRVGTLCTFDMKPRVLDQAQLDALADLAAVVVDELNLRKGLRVQAEITVDLREQTTELQHANQALEQYVQMASHDLRAPAQKLVNLADLAVLDTQGALKELVEPMRHSAVELEELVLGYARLASLVRGKGEQQYVSALIAHAQETTGQGLTVETSGDALVWCDSVLVSQALVNLFENIRKYGSEARAGIDTVIDGEEVRISVSNPVATNLQVDQTVFVPFRRLTSGGEGSGLGLSIVERVVQLHGGSVSARCDNEVFTVELILPLEDSN